MGGLSKLFLIPNHHSSPLSLQLEGALSKTSRPSARPPLPCYPAIAFAPEHLGDGDPAAPHRHMVGRGHHGVQGLGNGSRFC